MVRIIDKIYARRKEFKLERDSYIAKQQYENEQQQKQLSTSPTAASNIPSHIRNRPSPPRRSVIVKEEDTSSSTTNNDNNTKQQQPSSPTNTNKELQSQLIPGWYYSFEYFPPKTEPGLDNLQIRIDRMCRRLDPLFVSVTWGANGSTLNRTLAVASHAQREYVACSYVFVYILGVWIIILYPSYSYLLYCTLYNQMKHRVCMCRCTITSKLYRLDARTNCTCIKYGKVIRRTEYISIKR